MAYLSDVKAELKEMFDEMFKATWEVVEKNLKTSYKNGMKAAANPQKANGDEKPVEKSNRFRSKRTEREPGDDDLE